MACQVQKTAEMKRQLESRNLEAGAVPKKVKQKFGRREKRQITRTTNRNKAVQEPKRVYGDENGSSEESESSEEELEHESIASKRNRAADSKLAYSALVTLLTTKTDAEQQQQYDEEDDEEQRLEAEDEDVGDMFSQYGGNEEDAEEEQEDGSGSDSDSGSDLDLETVYDNGSAEDEEDESINTNVNDPFNLHFNDESSIEKQVNKFTAQSPPLQLSSKLNIKDEKIECEYQKLHYSYFKPSATNSGNTLKQKMKYYNVKQKVQKGFEDLKSTVGPVDLSLIDCMLQYETINYQYYTHDELKDRYQDYYTLHAINHVIKTTDLIIGNNEKKSKIAKQIQEGKLSVNDEPEFRDQGYYRPKVLILLPTRNIAWEVVNKLIKNSQVLNVDNKKKFQQQYYSPYKTNEFKPEDFHDIFDGNSNDFFTLGMKYSRKTMKLYCKIEYCDIIIASPLGLKMLIDKTHNADFLSSIEVCIIDKLEGLYMQNWSHLSEILSKLNCSPKNFEGLKVDFSRIRMWSINDQAQYLTQVMSFGRYLTPEIMSIVKGSKNLMNGSTLFKSINDETVLTKTKMDLIKRGLINRQVSLRQTFLKFKFKSIIDEPNDRFEFFKSVLLPQISTKLSYNFGTLLYIPSYIDYMRVVEYLENDTKVPFVAIDEYSSRSKLDSNRTHFQRASSHAKLLVYTERLHFYKRYDLKGVRNVIFYQLPTDPIFYKEVLKFIGDEKVRVDNEIRMKELREEEEGLDDLQMDLNLCSVKVAFDQLDLMKLEKIVGLKNTHDLIKSDNEIFDLN